jgi:hypothetical protein
VKDGLKKTWVFSESTKFFRIKKYQDRKKNEEEKRRRRRRRRRKNKKEEDSREERKLRQDRLKERTWTRLQESSWKFLGSN